MKKLIVLLIAFLTIQFCMGQEYYADVVIDVQNNGLVSIDGNTNHPMLTAQDTQDLTSKDGKYWIINISTDDKFSSFIYRLNLPENTELNYLKTPGLSRLEHTPSGLSVIGTGEDTTFFVIAQYSVNYKQENSEISYIVYASIALLAIIALISLFFYRKKEPLPKLTRRQSTIYKIIEKNKKPITQKEIEIRSGLPKASVSRNIETMYKKRVIKKEVKGISNVISIVPRRSGLFRRK